MYLNPTDGVPSEVCDGGGAQKQLERCRMVKHFDVMCIHLDIIPQRDGQTDRQTDRNG